MKTEGGQEFVFLPRLFIPIGEASLQRDALLCPSAHTNYPTRLFLSEAIAERPTIRGSAANWTVHTILGRTWHTWSWTGVSADLPLLQVLLSHMAALR